MSMSSRLRVLACIALATQACGRDVPPARTDSAIAPAAPAAVTPPATVAAGWDSSFGLALLVPSDSDGLAIAVYPDSNRPSLLGQPASVLDRAGAVLPTTIADSVTTSNGSCGAIAGWRLALSDTVLWVAGTAGGHLVPMRMDSVGSLSRRDSARLAADLTRLASVLPNGNQRFQGLPFAVSSLWRLAIPGRVVALAGLVRRLNQEAEPLEERTLLVAERDSGGGTWRAVFHEQTAGAEETVESADAVAAFYVGSPGMPVVLLARDFGNGIGYALLARGGTGRWALRWSSRRIRC